MDVFTFLEEPCLLTGFTFSKVCVDEHQTVEVVMTKLKVTGLPTALLTGIAVDWFLFGGVEFQVPPAKIRTTVCWF